MSYIASLNLLNSDSPAPHNEESFSDDLSLWANAQFTFDCAPGSALLEDEKKDEKLFASLAEFNLDGQQLQQTEKEQQNQQHQPINTHGSYITSEYLLSQLQRPNNTMLLPRLAPAPTEDQRQLLSYPGLSPIGNEESKNAKKKRSTNDPHDDQPLSVEDDKRRRNTAASARFRQKKKLREKALEQTSKEMSVKCETLEKRVRELELEAKWLRALVVEKNPSLLDDRSLSASTSSTTTETTTPPSSSSSSCSSSTTMSSASSVSSA